MRKEISLLISPNQFIDEITLDPRIDDRQAKSYVSIIKSIGFLGKIGKSNLYENFQ